MRGRFIYHCPLQRLKRSEPVGILVSLVTDRRQKF